MAWARAVRHGWGWAQSPGTSARLPVRSRAAQQLPSLLVRWQPLGLIMEACTPVEQRLGRKVSVGYCVGNNIKNNMNSGYRVGISVRYRVVMKPWVGMCSSAGGPSARGLRHISVKSSSFRTPCRGACAGIYACARHGAQKEKACRKAAPAAPHVSAQQKTLPQGGRVLQGL